MKYTLRQLEVFLATAKYENISRAAESLAMSQSAASGALKDLEAQFDMQLFDRIGKRLQLNELGVNIRAEAQVLLEQAKQLEGSLQGHQQATVNVGATVTIGNYLAINILQQFKAKYSDIDVTLDIANTAAIAQKIINFELDIALIEGEFWHPDLTVQPWCQDDLVVFCAPEHPLAELGGIDMTAIKRADWILREQGSGTRQRFDRAMAGKLDALSIALELKHTEAIKAAVKKNMGLSCLSRYSLAEEFERGDLVPLASPTLDLKRQFYFVFHKQKFQSEALQAWVATCRAMY